jgi:hypothetical protein
LKNRKARIVAHHPACDLSLRQEDIFEIFRRIVVRSRVSSCRNGIREKIFRFEVAEEKQDNCKVDKNVGNEGFEF